ncbi:hypothetical protein HK405_008074 [Cladochytrium tenue]|nr:hypothetical protein HK405_008074 [Cladochytrium tenue]
MGIIAGEALVLDLVRDSRLGPCGCRCSALALFFEPSAELAVAVAVIFPAVAHFLFTYDRHPDATYATGLVTNARNLTYLPRLPDGCKVPRQLLLANRRAGVLGLLLLLCRRSNSHRDLRDVAGIVRLPSAVVNNVVTAFVDGFIDGVSKSSGPKAQAAARADVVAAYVGHARLVVVVVTDHDRSAFGSASEPYLAFLFRR